MTGSKKTDQALDVLVIFNTAIKNVRLYPPASASVSSVIEKLYLSLLDLLLKEEQISFSESEKALLIDGRPLSPKDQERPHTVSLLNLLIGLGLKSITFTKGLEKEELFRFIELFSRTPESIQENGGINKLLTDQNIVHVVLDEKLYVAIDKDHQFVAGLDITDDQIKKFFNMMHPEMDPDSPQFAEMAKDPEALSKAFNTGLSKIMAQKETLTGVQLSESLNHMLSLLDKASGNLSDEKRDLLSHSVGQALIASDPALAEQLTKQNTEHLLGGFLLQYLLAEVMGTNASEGFGNDPDNPGAKEASGDSKSKLLQVAEKFSRRLQDQRTLLDEGLMALLPKIIDQLAAQKEQETIENMLERLIDNLYSESTEVRLIAAKSLADIIENLPDERKNEVVEKLSGQIIPWLTNETVFSLGYQRICVILSDTTKDHIGKRQFSYALKYLDAFNAVAGDAAEKPDDIKNESVRIIDQLACPENISILLQEIESPDQQRRENAGRVFTSLGNTAIEDLLDQLRTTTDSNERVQIMHLISTTGEKALPLITGRIKKEEPWFYLRNIAYLLGQIGNAQSTRALVPLLYRRNEKLRNEALKSIYRVGGDQRGKILMEAYPLVEEEFKPGIIEVLGQSKAADAVPFLMDLLRDKPLIASAARTTLEEKICSALGAIGSPDAIDLLSDITATKSFLGLRSYPERVKAAAARALITIQTKVGQSPER
ncbi:MAG: HEAT repeat domain-containing protein [Smithellaceae bacterium]|nr:HEAT repeat domain-containing protein [Smithellaceae bacterium]